MADLPREGAMRAVRAYAPELLDAHIVELGHGLSHVVFAAGDLVLRVGDVRSVGREARLLEAVASHVSIPIPKPRFIDEDTGVTGRREYVANAERSFGWLFP
jgi:aminoglycoside phosphotransferase (APT) family kinase protein